VPTNSNALSRQSEKLNLLRICR